MSDEERRFETLLDELQAAISQLVQVATPPVDSVFRFDAGPNPPPSQRARRLAQPNYADVAAQLYAERRKRDQILGLPGVFGEPAWDILLDLIIAHERKYRLAVSAVTAGSAAPDTTALRYIAVLEKRGLIERVPDEHDGRRNWVQLTKTGTQLMKRYIDCIANGPRELDSPIELKAQYLPAAK